jgi:hypothetical protein
MPSFDMSQSELQTVDNTLGVRVRRTAFADDDSSSGRLHCWLAVHPEFHVRANRI